MGKIRSKSPLNWRPVALLLVALSLSTVSSNAQNDDCATALVVTTGTHAANGPSTGAGCFNCGTATHADWFQFVAPGNGLIDVNSCSDPASTDTRVWIYDGTCASLNQVAANDDGPCNTTGYGSSVDALAVTSGTDYYIEWDDRWSTNAFTWDLVFTPAPSCVDPTSLEATTVGITNATVSWTTANIGAEYIVEYDTTGFILGTGATNTGFIDSNPETVNIATLQNTQYDVYVREVCAVGDSTAWIGPLTIMTLCDASASPLPYTENFDGGALPNCWTSSSSGDGWRFAGSPSWDLTNDHTTGASANGTVAWVDGSVSHFNDNSLLSPLINASLAGTPVIEFWVHSTNPANAAYTTLHVNLWDGLAWNSDVIVHTGETVGSTWQKMTIYLENFTIGGPIQVEFLLDETTMAGNFQNDLAIDDFKVFDLPQRDLEILSLEGFESGCGLSNSESGIVQVTNVGIDPMVGVNVYGEVNGVGASIIGSTDTIISGDTISIPVVLDLASPGSNLISIHTAHPDDLNLTNDTLNSVTVFNFENISPSYPFTESFESGPAGWISDGGVNQWELGMPSNTMIDTASDGVNAWVTDLDGDYISNHNGAVYSPCFDFSGLTNPQIQLDVWWESEFSWDGAVLQSSIDEGTTWVNVGANGDGNNWYNDGTINGNPGGQQEGWTGRDNTGNGSNGWVSARNMLAGLAGQPSVRFRIAFGSDVSVFDEGFAFDQFGINDSVYVATGPTAASGCPGDTEVFSVTTAGGTPYGYQWQVDAGSGFVDLAEGAPYSGVNSGTLSVSLFNNALNANNYRCLVGILPGWNDTSSVALLTVCNEVYSAFSVSACSSYTVPSGDETHTTSGVYMDTIPAIGAVGADSIMTITLDLVEAPAVTGFTNLSNHGTTVQWGMGAAPMEAGDRFVIRYHEFGNSPNFDYKVVNTSFNSGYTNGLDPNTRYVYRVGYKCAGETSAVYSDTMSVVTKCESTSGLSALRTGPSTADLSWTDVNASLYKIRYREFGTTNWQHRNVPGPASGVSLEELSPEFYEWQIRSICNGSAKGYLPIEFIPGLPTRLAASLDQEVAVYPNPTNGNLSLDINAASTGVATVLVLDLSGKTVQESAVNLTEGANRLRKDISELENGLYLLQINGLGINHIERIIKQ